jgi:hypothetical protein
MIPPRIGYFGDKEKAATLKGKALAFYDFVLNSMGGVDAITRDNQLNESTVIRAIISTNGMRQKYGVVKIYVNPTSSGEENNVYITFTDLSSVLYQEFGNKFSRWVLKNRNLISEEPTAIVPPLRALPLPRFNPTVIRDYDTVSNHTDGTATNIFMSDTGYWINNDNTKCISWNKCAYYIDGKETILSTNIETLDFQIVACCLLNKHIVVVTFENKPIDSGYYVYIYDEKGISVYSRRFIDQSYINPFGNIFKNGCFLSDKKTLIWSPDNGIARISVFSGDYSSSILNFVELGLGLGFGYNTSRIFYNKNYATLIAQHINYPFYKTYKARITIKSILEPKLIFEDNAGTAPLGLYYQTNVLFCNDENIVYEQYGAQDIAGIDYSTHWNNAAFKSGRYSAPVTIRYDDRRYAFDGELLAVCTYDNTVILNTKTKDIQVYDYPVDLNGISQTALSITRLTKEMMQ